MAGTPLPYHNVPSPFSGTCGHGGAKPTAVESAFSSLPDPLLLAGWCCPVLLRQPHLLHKLLHHQMW